MNCLINDIKEIKKISTLFTTITYLIKKGISYKLFLKENIKCTLVNTMYIHVSCFPYSKKASIHLNQ